MEGQAGMKKNTGRIIGIATALVLAVVAYRIVRWQIHENKYNRTVEGTIVFVDADRSVATIEVIDPRREDQLEITGNIPSFCPITINGQPGRLSDVRIGDRAEVKGRMKLGPKRTSGPREKTVTAEWVRITRGSEPAKLPQIAPAASAAPAITTARS